jgi:hypothetical protein
MNITRFTDYVKSRRAQFGSQTISANKAGITQAYWSEIERGDKLPTLDTLIIIAHALEVRPGLLIDLLDESIEDVEFEMLELPPGLTTEDVAYLGLLAKAVAQYRRGDDDEIPAIVERVRGKFNNSGDKNKLSRSG